MKSSNILSEAPPVIREFLGYLGTIKGKSPKTVEEYYLDLRLFFRYIKQSRNMVPQGTVFDEIPISDVSLELIKTIDLTQVFEYMNFLSTERHNSAATRSRKVSSMRSFFRYLTDKTGKLDLNPVQQLETPKLKKTLPKYLSLEQSIDLLSQVDGPSPIKERDYCILALFLNCGMRLSELVGLDYDDVHLTAKTVKITGKGNKERMVYLNEACVEAIQRYRAVRPNDGVIDKRALFLSSRKKRISPKTVQYIVKKYLAKIDLGGRGYSVHKLRHTAATLMYQQGHVDIRVLKDILGHENLGTTEIYTHVSNDQMAQAAEANPLAKVTQRSFQKSAASNTEDHSDKKQEPE